MLKLSSFVILLVLVPPEVEQLLKQNEANLAQIRALTQKNEENNAKIRELLGSDPDPDPDPTPDPDPIPGDGDQYDHYKVGMHRYPIVPATHIISSSGKWSELGIPKDAVVEIPSGFTVHYDSGTPIKHINLKGTLIFDPGSEMTVGTIQQYGGLLRMTDCKITFNHNVNQTQDPGAMLGGLLVTGGKVEVLGDQPGVNGGRNPYALLSSASANVLTFEPETMETWQVGDKLLVVESPDGNVEVVKLDLQHEEVTVKEATTTEIVLNETLKYNHDSYVVNMTRRIMFSGSGHVLFTGDADVKFVGVSIDGLGTTTLQGLDDTDWKDDKVVHVGTNNRGRYAIHAHHLRKKFLFSNCVVRGKADHKWSIVHHGSVGDIEDCVVVSPGGSAFAGEEGPEVGWWRRNMVVGYRHGDDSRHDYNLKNNVDYKGDLLFDFGKSGYAYWFCAPGIQCEDNICVGRMRWTVWYPEFERFAYRADSITYPNHPVFGGLAGKSIAVADIQAGIQKGSITDIGGGSLADWAGYQAARKKVRFIDGDWKIVDGDGTNICTDFNWKTRGVWTTGNQFTHPIKAKYTFRNGVVRSGRTTNQHLKSSATKNVWALTQAWENVKFVGGWNGIASCSKDCTIIFKDCTIEGLEGQSTDFFERIGKKTGVTVTATVNGETRVLQ